MVRLPRSSDMVLNTPAGLLSARYTRSSLAGIRFPSTRITWVFGSTRAPNLRTTSPSTSTRPAPIISSQLRRLPTPAAASTFCSRTPPGTSISESLSPGSMPQSSVSSPGLPPGVPARRRSRRMGTAWVLFVANLVGQERCQFGQLIEAGQAKPLKEVRGSPEQDRAALVIGSCLFDEPAKDERAHDAVAIDAAHSRHLHPAHRLPVGDHGEGLERRLGQPDLLAVTDELLHQRRELSSGVVTPATSDLAQLEPAALLGVGGSEPLEGGADLGLGDLEYLGERVLRHGLVSNEQDRFQSRPK